MSNRLQIVKFLKRMFIIVPVYMLTGNTQQKLWISTIAAAGDRLT